MLAPCCFRAGISILFPLTTLFEPGVCVHMWACVWVCVCACGPLCLCVPVSALSVHVWVEPGGWAQESSSPAIWVPYIYIAIPYVQCALFLAQVFLLVILLGTATLTTWKLMWPQTMTVLLTEHDPHIIPQHPAQEESSAGLQRAP